jgi:molecular chaperone GrpE (heat shock protein)
MLDGLRQWLSNLLKPTQPSTETVEAEEKQEAGLEQASELQRLRLETQEQQKQIEQLKAEATRRRSGREEEHRQLSRDAKEGVLRGAAAPAAQLKTQAHLLTEEGKTVEAEDILAVAERLVDALAQAGLGFEGEVGQTVSFDPDAHEALGTGPAPAPGDKVTVKVVGVSHEGKVLKKASVSEA